MLSENRAIIILLSILATIAVGVVLLTLRSVLLPMAGAVLLSYLFKPLVVWMQRRGVPMAITLIAVLMVVAVLLAALGGILYTTTSALIEQLPRYEARVTNLAFAGFDWVKENTGRIGMNLDEYIEQASIDVSTLTSALQSGLSSFVGFFGNVVIVLLFLMFMLAGTGHMTSKIGLAFSDSRAQLLGAVAANIDRQIRDYLVAKTLISLVTGTLTTVICLIIGVDFAVLWGLLTFILNFIPTFGSIVATILPATVALLQFESLFVPILTLALLFGTQFTMGNVVEPRLMGVRLNLAPLTILFSIILWAWLWGPWGMVLAVPITASLKIVFENVASLKPLSVLMGGMPNGAEAEQPLTSPQFGESPAPMIREASE